ncbi:MAG: TIM barrel protein [Clostridium sp.]
MIKLLTLTNHEYDMVRFQRDSTVLNNYLKEFDLQGIELIPCSNWIDGEMSEEIVKGVHLSFYPFWVDFWLKDFKTLIKEFDSIKKVEQFYGSLDRSVIVENYKKELRLAHKLKAEYVVFHVSHVTIEESYTYNFKHSNEEVINCTIELINEVFSDINDDFNIKILFENLWWPGLNFANKEQLKSIYNGINYKNKGFVLDTTHLINTNIDLKNEEDAINYCIRAIKDLGDYASLIECIHFNYSLSGDYIKNMVKEGYTLEEKFEERYYNVYSHISKMDSHKNFTSHGAKKIVELIKPKYVVYELVSENLDGLSKMIEIHNKILR